MMVAIALLVFPKLALGLSGFETGVAVMPQIRGDASDTESNPSGRIRGTHRLLTTAAVIMSVFLITSSIATVVLIPEKAFQEGGAANGRALAYLAHTYLGSGFGTVYDVVTIAILWFAGASAMAGLLNLVPRYLPRFGMAPKWARAIRPLVLVFTAIAFLITWIFQANVDAQGGAYATGVLVLMTSAAVAVTLSAHRQGRRGASVTFGVITAVFVYTTITNIVERPDGIKIAGFFILGILVVSFVSRVARSTELRLLGVTFDAQASEWIDETATEHIDLIAHEPGRDYRYPLKLRHAELAHHLSGSTPWFLEVHIGDSSDFENELTVEGVVHAGYRVLTVTGTNVPTTLAAVLLAIRDRSGVMPHIYFRWTEGGPIKNYARFLLFGEGEIAPMTREVLREAEPDHSRRPWVHVA